MKNINLRMKRMEVQVQNQKRKLMRTRFKKVKLIKLHFYLEEDLAEDPNFDI